MQRHLDHSAAELRPLLARIRRARFANGLHCPRCNCPHVQRWGSFSERQRYRCTGCRRTFSDLTGTPAAYSKLLPLWPAYCALMRETPPLRRAADELGIHPSTAHRWRHRLLRQLRLSERVAFAVWIELGIRPFPVSQKGCRHLGRPARRRGLPLQYLFEGPRVHVIFAADRRGSTTDIVTAARWPRGPELQRLLEGRVGRHVVLCHSKLELAVACREYAGTEGRIVSISAEGSAAHLLAGTRNEWDFESRFRRWLKRFRGVATRYLDHYVSWYRLARQASDTEQAVALMRWLPP